MKVLACGSRSWDDGVAVRKRLAELPRGTEVLHGDAPGADFLIERYCREMFTRNVLRLTGRRFCADWSRGKWAGKARNLEMLAERPDLVIAFWDGRSPGTGHVISQARTRKIPVEVIWAAGADQRAGGEA